MPFKCEACNREFQTQEALNSHNADRHTLSSHEAKELKRKLEEERKAKEASAEKKRKLKRTLLTYAALLVIFLALAGGATLLIGSQPQKPRLGPVGGIHIHSDWKFYVNGEALDFDRPNYQVRSRHVHVEGGDGDLVHVHATGVTFGYFLETLGFRLGDGCVTLDDGRELCNTGDRTWKFYVNGKPNSEWGAYMMKDFDKILLSYGNETEEQLLGQLETITDKARAASRVPGIPSHVPAG